MGKEKIHLYTHISYHGILLTMKEDEDMSFVGTWVESEVMPSELSQAQKAKYHMFSLIVELGPKMTMMMGLSRGENKGEGGRLGY
jgi:hypothetical protein